MISLDHFLCMHTYHPRFGSKPFTPPFIYIIFSQLKDLITLPPPMPYTIDTPLTIIYEFLVVHVILTSPQPYRINSFLDPPDAYFSAIPQIFADTDVSIPLPNGFTYLGTSSLTSFRSLSTNQLPINIIIS